MTLPALDSRYPLEDRAIETFRARGHVQVRTLATPEEVAAYQPAIDAATERYRWDKRPLEARDTYGRSFQQAMNLWQRDARSPDSRCRHDSRAWRPHFSVARPSACTTTRRFARGNLRREHARWN